MYIFLKRKKSLFDIVVHSTEILSARKGQIMINDQSTDAFLKGISKVTSIILNIQLFATFILTICLRKYNTFTSRFIETHIYGKMEQWFVPWHSGCNIVGSVSLALIIKHLTLYKSYIKVGHKSNWWWSQLDEKSIQIWCLTSKLKKNKFCLIPSLF